MYVLYSYCDDLFSLFLFFFFKQKTAYEMRISDWSSDVCSSDLPQEKDIKVPAWLNDPIYYHNRGNSTFTGESSTMGDFVGLDDLMTENPRVIQGFIDIYGDWIDRYKVDGFRIDRSEEHTSELQSLMRITYAVFCLKKKTNTQQQQQND